MWREVKHVYVRENSLTLKQCDDGSDEEQESGCGQGAMYGAARPDEEDGGRNEMMGSPSEYEVATLGAAEVEATYEACGMYCVVCCGNKCFMADQ